VRLAGGVCVCVCVCECVCVCVRERQKERKRERASESESERKESEREKERECVCVHSCMHKVTRGTQVKGTKRMKTRLALRVHEDVAVQHERLRLHADACRGSSAAYSSDHRSGTGSSRSHSARQCSRQDARVCGGHWLALRPCALQSAPGSRCSPTSSSSAA